QSGSRKLRQPAGTKQRVSALGWTNSISASIRSKRGSASKDRRRPDDGGHLHYLRGHRLACLRQAAADPPEPPARASAGGGRADLRLLYHRLDEQFSSVLGRRAGVS